METNDKKYGTRCGCGGGTFTGTKDDIYLMTGIDVDKALNGKTLYSCKECNSGVVVEQYL